MDAATTKAGLTDLKFRLVRESFADAVSWVAKNLPTRPAVPVLSGVLLSGSDDGLTISGFDYEVSAEAQVAAEIASPGSVIENCSVLPAILILRETMELQWISIVVYFRVKSEST